VKLVLTRAQMFTAVGHRPRRLSGRIGADTAAAAARSPRQEIRRWLVRRWRRAYHMTPAVGDYNGDGRASTASEQSVNNSVPNTRYQQVPARATGTKNQQDSQPASTCSPEGCRFESYLRSHTRKPSRVSDLRRIVFVGSSKLSGGVSLRCGWLRPHWTMSATVSLGLQPAKGDETRP
jgi:hypothetical protein